MANTANTKTIKLAQLGCGYWGPNLLRNFSSQPDCQVSHVVDPDVRRQEYVVKHYPTVTVVTDPEVVLISNEIDAVVIATPASSHYALAKEALNAGKHVFVEKPLAMNSRQAVELAELSKQNELCLMVGHTFLHNRAVHYLKKMALMKQLGELYYIYCQRLNLGQLRQDVNVWWNLAPHDISILLYLNDGILPSSISVHGQAFIQPKIEDVAFAILNWDSGLKAHIHLSWLDPGKVRKITLVGSKKMAIYDDLSEKKIAIFDKGIDLIPKIGEEMHFDHPHRFQLNHRHGDVLYPKIEYQEPLYLEAAHFLDSIRNPTQQLTDMELAVNVVRILEAGQRSIERGGTPENLN